MGNDGVEDVNLMTPRNGNNAKWIGENVEEILGG